MIDIAEVIVDASEGFDQVNEQLYRLGVTDGLPIVPPTAERVAAMLNGGKPDKLLARLPPAGGEATLYRLAICAVMAGCRPEYFPVLMAVTKAVSQSEFNLLGIQTTTGTATPLMIVNGPIVRMIGLNAGCNALGPGHRSNATLGRSLSLVLQNIGGALPGRIDLSTMGQPGKYTFCIAENEAKSTWDPFQVSRGFNPGQSTVTVVGASGTMEVKDDRSKSATSLLTTFAQSMMNAGSLGGKSLLSGGEPLFLISPEHAAIIGREMTRQQAQVFLFENARLPLSALSPEVADFVRQTRRENGCADEDLKVAERAEDIMLIVVGGVGIKSTYVPTWGGTTQAVTCSINAG